MNDIENQKEWLYHGITTFMLDTLDVLEFVRYNFVRTATG